MSDPVAAVMKTRKPIVFGLAASLIAFALDQITKLLALAKLSDGSVHSVLPFFNLRLSFNEGVSFGMFAREFAGQPLVLAGITALLVLFLLFMLFRSSTPWQAIAFGAIVGGALGNIADRLRIGAVVDFLDFHLSGYHWPAFNIADTAIVVGAAAVVLASFLERGSPSG